MFKTKIVEQNMLVFHQKLLISYSEIKCLKYLFSIRNYSFLQYNILHKWSFTEYFSSKNNLQGTLEPPVSHGDLGVYKMSLQVAVHGTFTLMQQLVVAFVTCSSCRHTLSIKWQQRDTSSGDALNVMSDCGSCSPQKSFNVCDSARSKMGSISRLYYLLNTK